MTRSVVTVSPQTPLHEVADLLAARRFNSVPVVNEQGTVLGIVTEEDLVTRVVQFHSPRYIMFLGSVIFLENPQNFEEEAEKILAMTAGDIMDRTFPQVRPDTPVPDIATRMLHEDLRRTLVLDEHGHLQGIITRADVVRMLSSGDFLP